MTRCMNVDEAKGVAGGVLWFLPTPWEKGVSLLYVCITMRTMHYLRMYTLFIPTNNIFLLSSFYIS